MPVLPGDAVASAVAYGPCAWTVDTGCCTDWATYDPALQTAATEFASAVLWSATGRQFGLCQKTVRPCGRACSDCASGFYWDSGTWVPYIFNGLWRNCWCGSSAGCCSCDPACQVYLPGPVASVSQVILDGNVVDPSTYRVDNGRWLVRTRTGADDTNCWPLCADQNVDSGAGLFTVTYAVGVEIPAALKRAAGTLACEYAKACLGLDCMLPERVTTIARQGLTIQMVDVDALLARQLTGITSVDQIIVAYNPNHLTSRPRLYSVDVPPPRETTMA